jgi:hypothetical protein
VGEWSASRPGRALTSGKGSPVPIVQEAGCASELVWTQRSEEKYFRLCWRPNLNRPVVQPVARHCTDWATRKFSINFVIFPSTFLAIHSLYCFNCWKVILNKLYYAMQESSSVVTNIRSAVKEIIRFYVNRRLITVCTRLSHWILSWITRIQSTFNWFL